jgi:hypothetical protein
MKDQLKKRDRRVCTLGNYRGKGRKSRLGVRIGKEVPDFRKVLYDAEYNLPKNGKGGTSSTYISTTTHDESMRTMINDALGYEP